jgi:hypothetical protein
MSAKCWGFSPSIRRKWGSFQDGNAKIRLGPISGLAGGWHVITRSEVWWLNIRTSTLCSHCSLILQSNFSLSFSSNLCHLSRESGSLQCSVQLIMLGLLLNVRTSTHSFSCSPLLQDRTTAASNMHIPIIRSASVGTARLVDYTKEPHLGIHSRPDSDPSFVVGRKTAWTATTSYFLHFGLIFKCMHSSACSSLQSMSHEQRKLSNQCVWPL